MKKSLLLLMTLAFLTVKSQAQSVVDYDGNVYSTVQIGAQIWLKQNLKVTHFANGTPITNIITPWEDTIPAYCNYKNDTNNSITYGRLYNWYAVSNTNGLCPTGWHVPTNGEWNLMVKYLDSTIDTTLGSWQGTTIGDQLKESGTTHWGSGNNGTNSSSFTALPSGWRELDDSSYNVGYTARWWTSSASAPWYAYARFLQYDWSTTSYGQDPKPLGSSVRCLKNLTTQIEDNKMDDHLLIYPNPATEKLFINCTDRKDIKMEVLNILGDCVLKSQLKDGVNSIDISSFSSGMYVIRLNGANGTYLKKLIKN